MLIYAYLARPLSVAQPSGLVPCAGPAVVGATSTSLILNYGGVWGAQPPATSASSPKSRGFGGAKPPLRCLALATIAAVIQNAIFTSRYGRSSNPNPSNFIQKFYYRSGSTKCDTR